ncbi:MAG: peptidase domain protein [Gemmatimonadetes bacterium]|nr:peptidase domain protein [Gemmatimonadota bacterium]
MLDPLSVIRTVLPNGLTVLVRRDRSAPVVAIVTYVKAGYFDETDDVAGISHVLEHMYFKGTPTRAVGEIARQTKAVGGYLNAATIYDHTVYYTVVPSSGFVEALDVQADAFANSAIDAGELAKELEVIIQEAKRKSDNPGAVTSETLYELLHDRHRMRRWRIGREPGLRALTREHMMRFYRNFYHPGNTVLSIVGDVDPDVVMREVMARHGQLPAGEPERSPGPVEEGLPGFRYRELDGDIVQAQVAFGWRTPGTLHPDTPALELLAMVLGSGRASRFYRGVRERKLATSVSAYDYTPTELGVFVAHAEAPGATLGEAARAMWAEIRAVREDGIGALELERARRIFESRWIRRLEDMEGQANYLAEWETAGSWGLGERLFERLMTVTADEVREAARVHLDPDHASVMVYRPRGVPVLAADARAMRALLDGAPAATIAVSAPIAAAPVVATQAPVLEGVQGDVHVFRTAAGVPVLVRVKPGSPLVHAGAWVQGGASEESERNAGVTQLMVRAAVKGTARRTAAHVAEEGELLGGSVSGGVGGESFGWSVSVPSRHAAAACELLADVAQHPRLSQDTLETERTIAIGELQAMRDDMYRWPMRMATQAAFAGHAYGIPGTGTEESLASLDEGALRDWHREHFLRGDTVLGIVGDGAPAALAEVVARHFDALVPGQATRLSRPEWPEHMEQRTEQRDKAQSALLMMFPGPARDDDDRFAVALIASVASGLGGRFFDELRDKQSLAYTVHAFASERKLAGTFAAYIATSPEKEAAAREGLLREFAKLREEPVTAEELSRAQTYAIGVHAIRQQSGGALLGDMVEAWMYGSLSELADFESRVRAVTATRMMDVARKYFDPERRIEGIVRGQAQSS